MIQCPKCSAENPPDNKFCGSCGEELSSLSQAPTVAAPEGEAAPSPVQSPHVGRIVSSDSVPAGGFTPGTILADRYRVIGLLGRGGMGEVYRADDLKLGQPVALKFLPPKLSDDPVRRERFFAEVRITRQLSHPNICRVYDIGDVDGRHFLSMEYIDGEDLASLMKRIGSLTNEKALDIARQLVAGLTVAHERGVLHRDLKPANIMLDGHGRVRITDFGLAIAVGDESQAEEIAGTPAYMAPEQLAGKGATIRSDIYSLGLILYEICTGKKAFKATTLAELREQKETQTPRAPSELRDGIDPVVERVIQRCMEKDPNARPASVAQLAQALPGGDPLAAAIAAGETPSPEMVAASGSKEGLRPLVAWGLLALIILVTLAIITMMDRYTLQRRVSDIKSPDILVARSQEIIKKAGYSDDFADRAYGFVRNVQYLNYIQKSDKIVDRWKSLDSKAILFWYRQSPQALQTPFGDVTKDSPTLQYSGEIMITLDAEGQLVSLAAIPIEGHLSPDSVQALDWEVFFSEAGLDYSQWAQKDAQVIPHSFADTRVAWEPSSEVASSAPNHVEAAAFQGRPVSFEILGPWTQETKDVLQITSVLIRIIFFVAITITVMAGGVFIARRNLRLGRGDKRNANRLAFITAGLAMATWILNIHHTVAFEELSMLLIVAVISMACGGFFWVLYIALEPFVRRRWPQILVGWTRLLSGKFRDPLVARDALIGSATGLLLFFFVRFLNFVYPSLAGSMEFAYQSVLTVENAMGSRFFVSNLLWLALFGIGFSLLWICSLYLLRILLRNQAVAAVAWILLMSAADVGFESPWLWAIAIVQSSLILLIMMRFGLVATMFIYFMYQFFLRFSVTFHPSVWYSDYNAIIILAAIVLYAFRTSLGGHPIFGTPRLDE
jgi:predicted Ser/Thr protein kinase